MTSKVEDFADDLRARIESGEFGIRGGIPPLGELAKSYRISPDTARRGLALLVADGLLSPHGKAGYHVDKIERIVRTNSKVLSLKETLQAQGETYTSFSTEDPSVEVFPSALATLLDMTPTPIVHRRYVRGSTERLYEICEYWYPVHEATQFLPDMANNPDGDFLDKIMRLRNVPSVQVLELVSIRTATSEEIAFLGIPKYSSIMESIIKCIEPDGTVVCVMKMISISAISHRYTYPYTLS